MTLWLKLLQGTWLHCPGACVEDFHQPKKNLKLLYIPPMKERICDE